jgi:hypothetical protein
VLKMMMMFWVLASCRLVGRCQRFGEKLHSLSLPFLQPYINPYTSQHRQFIPEDGDSMFLLPTSLHDTKTQKNNIIILTAGKNSSLTAVLKFALKTTVTIINV